MTMIFRHTDWEFLEDDFGRIREFVLEHGIKYRVTVGLPPRGHCRLLNEYLESKAFFKSIGDQSYVNHLDFVYDKAEMGDCMIVQYRGGIDFIKFEIVGVDIERLKKRSD